MSINPPMAVSLLTALIAASAGALQLSPYGVNAHAPAEEDLTRIVARTSDAGIGWLRIDLVWALVELEPGLYDWSLYDEIVDEARSRGLEILAIVAYTPAWATDGPELAGVPREPSRWSDFCHRAAARYRGRVRAWEIWNEPNLDHFWAGTRRQYLEEILIPGSAAVRAADPGALVTGPGLAHLTSGDRDWYRWLQEVVAVAGDRIDILSHHAYDRDGHLEVTDKLDGSTAFGDRPELWDLIVPSLREVLEEVGWTGPVWLTETGWASDEVGEELQAVYLAGLLEQWLSGTVERSWLDAIFIYEIEDGGAEGFPEFGLLRADGTAKPAFRAYRDFIAAHPGPLPGTLELHDGRFTVEVRWRDPLGVTGFGAPVPLVESTGAFWFFDADSLDLLVKVLDGRAINGNYWVFFGALSDVQYEVQVRDHRTGQVRSYGNPAGTLCGQGDVEAFAAERGGSLSGSARRAAMVTGSRSGCSTTTEVCFQEGRFEVSVEWRDPKTGVRRPAVAVPAVAASDTGLFWFFDSGNLELAVKILDGRGVNGHFWVYAGALSDVEYWIQVSDTASAAVREYHNPPGTLCGLADIEAF